MTKISSFFQKLNIFLFLILFLEGVILFSEIDILPILFIGVICGFIIVIRNRNGVLLEDNVYISDIKSILTFLIFSLVVVLVFLAYLTKGVSVISSIVLSLLNDYKWFRFLIYGVVFPLIFTYLMLWCWSDVKPFSDRVDIELFMKIILINLFLGIIVCINWEGYLNIANFILSIFG